MDVVSPATNRSAPVLAPGAVTRHRRVVFRWIERFLAVVGFVTIFYHAGFTLIVITSGSMSPALQGNDYETGDRVLAERITGWFHSPRRWEIYCFYEPDGTFVAKRVVALPGERISIKGTRVLVNGSEIARPVYLSAIKYYGVGQLSNGREVDCGPDYYMLGDDSRDSYDSRYIGPVPGSKFQGRVRFVLRPWARFGSVN
jgi:signal peptidase I